jgi:formylmethanofuran dehydrogenase subunit A
LLLVISWYLDGDFIRHDNMEEREAYVSWGISRKKNYRKL